MIVVLALGNDKSYIGSWVLPNAEIPSNVPLDHFETMIEAIEMSSGIEFFPSLDRRNILKLSPN